MLIQERQRAIFFTQFRIELAILNAVFSSSTVRNLPLGTPLFHALNDIMTLQPPVQINPKRTNNAACPHLFPGRKGVTGQSEDLTIHNCSRGPVRAQFTASQPSEPLLDSASRARFRYAPADVGSRTEFSLALCRGAGVGLRGKCGKRNCEEKQKTSFWSLFCFSHHVEFSGSLFRVL